MKKKDKSLTAGLRCDSDRKMAADNELNNFKFMKINATPDCGHENTVKKVCKWYSILFNMRKLYEFMSYWITNNFYERGAITCMTNVN